MQNFAESGIFGLPDLFTRGAKLERAPEKRPHEGFGGAQGAVKINLAKHVVARLQIIFDGVDPAGGNIQPVVFGIDLKAADDPLQVVDAVFDPGHQ